MFLSFFISFIFCITNFSVTAEQAQQNLGAPLYDKLGDYHKIISTKNPLAQKYFDQGLILLYGFEYTESIRSFKESTRLDPSCAMCFWGLALSLGSNAEILSKGGEREEAYDAVQKALQLVDKNNVSELYYIKALSQRYASKTSSEGYNAAKLTKDEMQNFADAMKKVMQANPNDVDAKLLYAAALADMTDWKFFTEKKELLPNTAEVITILESAIAQSPQNPAAHHFYIHAMEASPHPEKAMQSADLLRNAVPGAVHLLHMPSHIYSITGRMHDATLANIKSIEAFKDYKKVTREQGFEPELSYQYHHSLHYLSDTATKEGNKELALAAAKELVEQTPLEAAKERNLQLFYTVPYRVEVNFKMWKEILEEPKPVPELQFQTAIWHYARAYAYFHQGQKEKAKEELSKLKEILAQGPTKENMKEDGVKQMQVSVKELEKLFEEASKPKKSTS